MIRNTISMLGRVTYSQAAKSAGRDGITKVYLTLSDADDDTGRPEQMAFVLPVGQAALPVGAVGRFEISCIPVTKVWEGKVRVNYEIHDFKVTWVTVKFEDIPTPKPLK